MSETTPAPRAYTLGAELRDARRKAGLGLRQLAGRIDLSHSVLVRWERGERVPSPESVAALAALLGLSGTRRDKLVELSREAAAEPSNSVSIGANGEAGQLTALLQFERIATAITNVSSLLVPGLLQTADYARAIMGTGIPDDEVERRVAMRIGRRDVITRKRSPVRYTAVLLESVLAHPVGTRDVLAEQLRFLLELGGRDNVAIQVIPRSAGWTPAHAGPFVLLEFPKADPVVHLEHHRSSAFLRHAGDVCAFLDARDDVQRVAMSPVDSAELITRAIDRTETMA